MKGLGGVAASFMVLGAAIVAIAIIWAVAITMIVRSNDAPTQPEACYGVYGKSGEFYPSVQTPYSHEGVWYTITQHQWNAVMDAEATFTDRDCLRRRYPDNPQEMVPPVEGVDE